MEETPRRWQDPDYLALWQYFGNVGAADKNTMVTVETWLLGLLVAGLGYAINELVCFSPPSVTRPLHGVCLAILGTAVAILAIYVALLYGGYSTRNWARADRIAEQRQAEWTPLAGKVDNTWAALLPTSPVDPAEGRPAGWHWELAWHLGRPCSSTKLPPIFGVFTYLGVLAGLAYLTLLGLSLKSLPDLSNSVYLVPVGALVASALVLVIRLRRVRARRMALGDKTHAGLEPPAS